VISDFENLARYTEVNIRPLLLVKKSVLAQKRFFCLPEIKKVVTGLLKIGRIFTFLQNMLRDRREP
jgi:hypothetical protein